LCAAGCYALLVTLIHSRVFSFFFFFFYL
jgi:hypothetical protein